MIRVIQTLFRAKPRAAVGFSLTSRLSTAGFSRSALLSTVLLFAGVLLLGSCTKDTLDNGGKLPPVPEGYVRASISTNVSDNEQVKTRATDTEEKAYDDANVWVLMFNATSASDATPTTIMQAPVKATKTGTQLFALLRATAQPVTIYVVTGLTASMNTYLGTASNFDEGTTTYAAISALAQLQTVAVTAAGVPVGGTNYFPMCTDAISYTSGTTTLTEITANFKRIVAKIDVDASTLTTADFALEGITLANGAQKGFVFPQTTLATNNGGVMQYTEKTTVTSNKILSQVYLYENNGTPNPTTVIVKGKYKGGASTYYRMDLHVETTAGSGVYTPYSMERNKHYTITITEIQNGGYATLDEALANKPSNAKYTVTVIDPDSHDVVSNGEYYLGVSNSEFVVYGDGELSSLLATTVTHNANSSTVSTNSISVSGGLTLVTSTLTAAPNVNDKKTDVLVTLPVGFTTSSTGTITITLGNLTKTVKVTRKAQLSAWGGVISDFSGTDYVLGTVESSGTGDWLKLSAQSDGSNPTSAANKNVVSPSGGIYLAVNSNVAQSGSVIRTGGSFFASRRSDEGRVKVVAYQNFTNLGVMKKYVGAFWRKSQTGERLINYYPTADEIGDWSATVTFHDASWAADDILLSTSDLPTYPYIGLDLNAENRHVTEGSATVSGNAADITQPINFRIGLKSTFASTLATPARYAVVTLTYNNGAKTHKIYLRQGEEADYLFRPTDEYGGPYTTPGVTGPNWRQNAKKFTPYNLTDRNMGTGGSNLSNHNQLSLQSLSTGENRFTDYPSQAGAFFQWAVNSPNERRAYHPINPIGAISGWSSITYPETYWNTLGDTNEDCPAGYRRPNDGVTDHTESGGFDIIANSEMRQSLYYTPALGSGNYYTSNMVNGYYADGFFDRRVVQNGAKGSTPNCAVSNSTKDIAYGGYVFFNHANNASIFFPAAGYRWESDGSIISAGLLGMYWSSSSYTIPEGLGNNSWGLYSNTNSPSGRNIYQSTFNRKSGYSMRCVLQ